MDADKLNMKKQLQVIGCASLLALFLAWGLHADSISDAFANLLYKATHLGPPLQTGASTANLEIDCGATSFSQCGLTFSHGGYGMGTYGWFDNFSTTPTAPQFSTLLDALNLYDYTDGSDRIESLNGANAPIFLQPVDGNVGVGTCRAVVQTFNTCGSTSTFDPTGLELTSLTNGTLTSGTAWTQTNDCTFPGTGVTCAYSSGLTSSFTQATGALAIPAVGNRVYKFTYAVSGAAGNPVAAVVSTFANATAGAPKFLDLINGTHILYLQSIPTVLSFSVNTTLTTGQAFTLTNLSLQQVNAGNQYIGGRLLMGNCTSSASPALCGAAAAGSVTIAAGATTIVVDNTLISANSTIIVTEDESLGTKLGVTCNTQSLLVLGSPRVTARSGATSFTVAIDVAPTTNPMCIGYQVIN
jgi:hypothetical protein